MKNTDGTNSAHPRNLMSLRPLAPSVTSAALPTYGLDDLPIRTPLRLAPGAVTVLFGKDPHDPWAPSSYQSPPLWQPTDAA
jgi:hypothetical protein